MATIYSEDPIVMDVTIVDVKYNDERTWEKRWDRKVTSGTRSLFQ